MNIKKVDDKPMVIHTKKKATLHIVKKKCKDKPKHRIKLASFAKSRRVKISNGYVNNPRLRKLKLDRKAREEALPKKKGTINSNVKAVSAVGVSAALNHMEGGNEVKEAAMVAYGVAQPVAGVTKKSSEIYRNGLRRMKKQRIKQVKAGTKISKREIKKKEYLIENENNDFVNTTAGVSNTETGAKANTSKESKSSARKRYAKSSDNSTVSPGSRLKIKNATFGSSSIGKSKTKSSSGKGDSKANLRSRKIQFFLDKMRAQDEQKDSLGKMLKDIVAGKLMAKLKASIAIIAAGLVLLLLLFTVVIVPVTSVIAVIYNSPFAIFFPPLESGDTVITVTGSYVSEFNREINELVNTHQGCDMGMKVYVDYEGSEANPSNNYDIMAVYMVKYGVGDTATIMNSTSKDRLKQIVDDMCSYTTSTGTEQITDSNGNTTSKSCYYVNVTLKTFQDMITEYGFSSDEIAILEDMMSPESMAMINSDGGDGLSTMTEDEIADIVSGISDSKAKKSVRFALTKVGYPYSQEYRDSGDYYDCSSLAYYSWKDAGVDISYGGATTAAAEAEGLVNNGCEIAYDEMEPGDLIFYSFCHNGRYQNISHVAIYAGDNKVVEAKSEEYGVVYGSIYSVGSIVCICRPN